MSFVAPPQVPPKEPPDKSLLQSTPTSQEDNMSSSPPLDQAPQMNSSSSAWAAGPPNQVSEENVQNVGEDVSNFSAATNSIEQGPTTRWIKFYLEKSLRSQTWSMNDEEIARFCYKTLGLKKGQIKSWDDSLINQQSVGNKAFKIEIINDVDLTKLPLHQGLELKKGLRTKPVKTGSNSTSAGIWIRIYKTAVLDSDESIKKVLSRFGVVTSSIQHMKKPKRNTNNVDLNNLAGVRTGDRICRFRPRQFLPTWGFLPNPSGTGGKKIKFVYDHQIRTCGRCNRIAGDIGTGYGVGCKGDADPHKCSVEEPDLPKVDPAQAFEMWARNPTPYEDVDMPEIQEGSVLEISRLPNTLDRQNFMDWLKEHEVDMILIENMLDTDIPSTKLVKGLSTETQKWIIGKMDGRTYEGKSLRFTSVIRLDDSTNSASSWSPPVSSSAATTSAPGTTASSGPAMSAPGTPVSSGPPGPPGANFGRAGSSLISTTFSCGAPVMSTGQGKSGGNDSNTAGFDNDWHTQKRKGKKKSDAKTSENESVWDLDTSSNTVITDVNVHDALFQYCADTPLDIVGQPVIVGQPTPLDIVGQAIASTNIFVKGFGLGGNNESGNCLEQEGEEEDDDSRSVISGVDLMSETDSNLEDTDPEANMEPPQKPSGSDEEELTKYEENIMESWRQHLAKFNKIRATHMSHLDVETPETPEVLEDTLVSNATASSSTGDLTDLQDSSPRTDLSERSVSFTDLRYKWTKEERKAWREEVVFAYQDKTPAASRKRSCTLADLSGSSGSPEATNSRSRKKKVKKVSLDGPNLFSTAKEDLDEKLAEAFSDEDEKVAGVDGEKLLEDEADENVVVVDEDSQSGSANSSVIIFNP